MRKVKVSRTKLVPHESGSGFTRVPDDFLAVFHDFAIDTDNSQGHNETYPVAIIERGDGTIEIVHAEQIQFVNPTLYKTCENQS